MLQRGRGLLVGRRILFGETLELGADGVHVEGHADALERGQPDPDLTRGQDLRIVVEAKDRKVSGREMREELRAAKTNRDAAVGLVVFTPQHAPAGIAPFDVRAGDVYVVLDPANPDPAALHAAVRLARLLALASLRESEAELDVAAVQEALTSIREALEVVRALKVQLTSIGTTSVGVSAGLEKLREAILAWIVRAERELAPGR